MGASGVMVVFSTGTLCDQVSVWDDPPGRLDADTATLWDRRHELLGDIDRMADKLHDAAREAAGRLARVGSEDSDAEATAVLPKPPRAKQPGA